VFVIGDPTGRHPATASGYEYSSPYPVYQGPYQRRGGTPVPVVGPVVGVGAAALCLLAGCWLMLAPFALGLARHGRVPRAATVDWVSGAVLALVALGTAALFTGCVRRRLRAAGVLPERRRARAAADQLDGADQQRRADLPRQADPVDELVDDLAEHPADLAELLAPLVSALTADLRARQTTRAGAGASETARGC
jgi:hypothetical protein